MRYFLKGFAYKRAGLILILGQKDAAVIRVTRFFKARRLLEAILYFVSSNFQSIPFFCPKCKYFLFLHKNSHIEKFEGSDFENDNSFFQIPAKNTQIRNFL